MTRLPALLLTLVLAVPALAQDAPRPDAPPPDAPKAEGDDRPVEIPADAWEGVERVPVELVHRYRVGARSRYQVRQSVSVDTGGAGPNQQLDQTFEATREVIEAPGGGGARLRETYDAVAYSMQVGAQSFALDTRDGTRSGLPALDALAAMVGAPLETRIAADGKVEAVEGSAALLERVLAAVPDDQREAMRERLAGTYSDDAMTRQLQESHIVFPGRALAPGETWRRENTIAMPNVGDLQVVNDYVLLGVVARDGVRCAKLLHRAASKGCEPRDTQLPNGVPATMSVEPFEATATVHVRLDDGQAIEVGPLTLAMVVHITVQGQQVHMTATSITRCELLPDEAPTAPEKR